MNNKPKNNLCPSCGQHNFPDPGDGINICPHCGWTHDMISENKPSVACGPNDLSLEEHKFRYQYYVRRNHSYHWKKDGFPETEQIIPMDCPVCGKYRFSPLSWFEKLCGDEPFNIYCTECGWHYDDRQHKEHSLGNGNNLLSLDMYKADYIGKIEKNPNYRFVDEQSEGYIAEPHECPVCGKYQFKDHSCFDICPYCGWEDDGTDKDDSIQGANDLCFKDYQERYRHKLIENPKYTWKKNE